MSFLISNAISGAVGALVGFVLGYVGKKAFWRSLVRFYKWMRNSMMSFELIAVRTYLPARTKGLNRGVSDRLRVLYTELKILKVSETAIVFQVPLFGNLRLVLDEIDDVNEHDGDRQFNGPNIVKIKASLKTESPINLGAKDIGQLKQFVDYADKAFTAAEMFSFEKPPTIKEDYVIIDTDRIARFRAEDRFDIEDKQVGARVRGTVDKLEMMVAPSSKVVEATKKYRYA